MVLQSLQVFFDLMQQVIGLLLQQLMVKLSVVYLTKFGVQCDEISNEVVY